MSKKRSRKKKKAPRRRTSSDASAQPQKAPASEAAPESAHQAEALVPSVDAEMGAGGDEGEFWELERELVQGDVQPQTLLEHLRKQLLERDSQDSQVQALLERERLHKEEISRQNEVLQLRVQELERELALYTSSTADETRDTTEEGATTQASKRQVLVSLADCLEERGVATSQQGPVSEALAAHFPQDFCGVLCGVREELTSFLEGALRLCCAHPTCQELARGRAFVHLVQEESRCEICGGSENQRAIKQLAQYCLARRCYRVTLIGGSPRTHDELQRLWPTSLSLRLISGKKRRSKQQASEDLRRTDLLIIWGPTILKHRVSELYTDQKDRYGEKICVVKQGRGLSSLVRETIAFLERCKDHQ